MDPVPAPHPVTGARYVAAEADATDEAGAARGKKDVCNSYSLNRRYVFALLRLSLFGSAINIPVAQLPGKEVVTGHVITYFGMRYVVPTVQ